MRTLDLLVLLACSLAIVFSFQEEWRGSHATAELSWAVPIDAKHFLNGHFPNRLELLADPLITDLDGDGFKEIIIASSDNRVRVYDGTQMAPGSVKDEFRLPEPQFRFEASSASSFRGRMNKRIVAMATGWLGDEGGATGLKPQVLVVVTNDYTVLCFNHRLKLLWESHVREEISGKHYLSEVAITISPQPIRVGDRGAVFVGGRLRRRVLTKFSHDHQMDDTAGDGTLPEFSPDQYDDYQQLYDEVPAAEDATEGRESRRRTEDLEDEHFSYYAFDGKTGAQVWKHEANDFLSSDHEQNLEEQEREHLDKLLPSHSVKLSIVRALATRHMGQVDWREHRESILAQLPHIWRHPKDTLLSPAAFKRPRQQGRTDKPRSSFRSGTWGLGKDATSTSESNWKPNVLVAHDEKGLEIVHYYTGRTLCTVNLYPGTFGDVNGDGMIDHLHVNTRDPEQKYHCIGKATTGIPPSMDLWEVSICGPGHANVFLQQFDVARVVFNGQVDRIAATAPVTIPSIRNSAGSPTLKLQFSSYSSSPASPLLDTVFLVSNGWVTSVAPSGEINWQLKTEAEWVTTESEEEMEENMMKDPSQDTLPPHFASLSVMDIGGGTGSKAIVALGRSLVLISTTGEELASVAIPNAQSHGPDARLLRGFSLAPPTLGDFNNDGYTDIIVHSSEAFYGFTVRTKMSYPVVPVLGFGLLITLALLAYQKQTASVLEAQAAKAGKRH